MLPPTIRVDDLPRPLPPARLSAGRDGLEEFTAVDLVGHDEGPASRGGLLALAAVDEVAALICPDAMRFVERIPGPEGEGTISQKTE